MCFLPVRVQVFRTEATRRIVPEPTRFCNVAEKTGPLPLAGAVTLYLTAR
jgi:hypothetical protein